MFLNELNKKFDSIGKRDNQIIFITRDYSKKYHKDYLLPHKCDIP